MSLEDIDSALIVVCLEEDDLGRDQAAEFSHMMLHGNGINRSTCSSDGLLKRTAGHLQSYIDCNAYIDGLLPGMLYPLCQFIYMYKHPG